MNSSDIIKLIASILICEGAGGIGSIFTMPRIPTWYKTLKKPPFTPPNWLFGPVWITLYLLMGIAVFLIWRGGLEQGGSLTAFIIFWVQLAINILWSVIFFGFRSLVGGAVLIIILWIMILVTIISFFGLSNVAGGLLIPYIVWVSVASYLNIGVWRLNPTKPK